MFTLNLARAAKVLAALCALAGFATRAHAEPVQASASRIMVVVAHQDDDIMVSVPDLVSAVRERRAIQTVYLTSGDAGFTCNAYTQGREQGAKAQQAFLAGVPNQWVDEERVIQGKHVRFSRLTDTAHSMVFLGLPNPALFSTQPPEGALQLLWLKQIQEVATLPFDGRSAVDRYTREQLIELLRALMLEFAPQDVRVLDASQQQIPIYPFEHVDHMGSAMFATAAFQRYAKADALTFYPLYSVQFAPENLSATMTRLRRDMFAAYRAFDPKVCDTLVTSVCGVVTNCDANSIYDPFWPRSYPVDTVRGSSKQLRSPSGLCLEASGSSARLAFCNSSRSAQRWTLERGGVIKNAATGQCLNAASASQGQALGLQSCARVPSQQFYLTTQAQLRGPDATCVVDALGPVTLAECKVDMFQLGWKLQ